MRETYVHEAVLTMASAADDRAPGGAITVALCGSWDHEPPCPLAPHNTATDRTGDEVRLRVVFACDPAAAPEVRARIDAALTEGTLVGPDGLRTNWRLTGTQPGSPRDDEHALGERLAQS